MIEDRHLYKFIVDVCVGHKVENVLKELFSDVKSMWEVDPKAADITIMELAIMEERIIVTMDKDFGELVFNGRIKHTGVLLLRLDYANGEEKAIIVRKILETHLTDLKNNFCVYQNGKLRVKGFLS